VLQGAAWIVLADVIVACLATGVGSLTGSRAVTLTAVIGWLAIATPLLLNTTFLGSARDGLLAASLGQVGPIAPHTGVNVATAVAIPVLIAWLVVPFALGAWRTQTKDA